MAISGKPFTSNRLQMSENFSNGTKNPKQTSQTIWTAKTEAGKKKTG